MSFSGPLTKYDLLAHSLVKTLIIQKLAKDNVVVSVPAEEGGGVVIIGVAVRLWAV